MKLTKDGAYSRSVGEPKKGDDDYDFHRFGSLLVRPGVNFTNILRAHFSYESAFL